MTHHQYHPSERQLSRAELAVLGELEALLARGHIEIADRLAESFLRTACDSCSARKRAWGILRAAAQCGQPAAADGNQGGF